MHPWYLPPPFNVAQVIRGDAAARAVPQGGIEKIVNFFLRQFAVRFICSVNKDRPIESGRN
jgi:hypothetical protein